MEAKANSSAQGRPWVRCRETWCLSSCYFYMWAPSLNMQVWGEPAKGSAALGNLEAWATEDCSPSWRWDSQASSLETQLTDTTVTLQCNALQFPCAGSGGRGVFFFHMEEAIELEWGYHSGGHSCALQLSGLLWKHILLCLTPQQSCRWSWTPYAPFHIPSLINLY